MEPDGVIEVSSGLIPVVLSHLKKSVFLLGQSFTHYFHVVFQLQSNWSEITDNFDDMNLKETLLRGIYAYGFEKPSAIQQRAIIPCIKGISTKLYSMKVV